jgi:hypothetical protein
MIRGVLGFAMAMLLGACGQRAGTPPLAASDGYEVGNGGVVMECTRGKASTLELLDFYRASFTLDKNYQFSFGKQSKTLDEKVAFSLTRLKRLDQARADKYQRLANTFFARAHYVAAATLPDTRDYGDLPNDPQCAPRQIVLQKRAVVSSGAEFLIVQSLWDRLDDDRRAALVLHEVIYEDAIARGHKNSLNTQLFVALLSSSLLDRYSSLQYNQMIQRMQLASSNDLAPYWDSNPLDVGRAYCAGVPVAIDLALFAHHPNAEPLSFSGVSLPSWLRVNEQGVLEGTASVVDGPTPAAIVRATHVTAYADTELRLEVVDCDHEPLLLTWRAEVLQHGVLPRVGPRTYVLVSGPDWLSFNAKSGDLSATPPADAVGDHQFVFTTTGDSASRFTLTVNVTVVENVLQKYKERWSGLRRSRTL